MSNKEEEATRDNSVMRLERSTFGGWRDNTKGVNKGEKLKLDRPSTPNKIPQHSSFIAKGQQIVLNPQKSKEYTLSGKIQNMVDNPTLGIESQKNKKESIIEDGTIGILDEVDNENLTNRAIRTCLAAEAVVAALREECNLLPARSTEEKFKIGHARRGCNCPGKGATCNAAISLQLQLTACENLSLAATAAVRELVAARLGVPMPTPSASSSISPKKQRKKSKKPKNEPISGHLTKIPPDSQLKTPLGLQLEFPPRGSILLPNRKSISGIGSLTKELSTGPFSCSHPTTECVPQIKARHKSSFGCSHPPIVEDPHLECLPGMFNVKVITINVDLIFSTLIVVYLYYYHWHKLCCNLQLSNSIIFELKTITKKH